MKGLIKILVLVVVLVAVSCKKDTAPNYQFMPNMYESEGYETYGEAAFPNGIEAQLPAEGSVARGYIPFDIENTTEGYELAKATLMNSFRFNTSRFRKRKRTLRYILWNLPRK